LRNQPIMNSGLLHALYFTLRHLIACILENTSRNILISLTTKLL
jgi:hypothetical protein